MWRKIIILFECFQQQQQANEQRRQKKKNPLYRVRFWWTTLFSVTRLIPLSQNRIFVKHIVNIKKKGKLFFSFFFCFKYEKKSFKFVFFSQFLTLKVFSEKVFAHFPLDCVPFPSS